MKISTTTQTENTAFYSADCQLLAKFKQSIKFNQIDSDDQARLRDLRSRIKANADLE